MKPEALRKHLVTAIYSTRRALASRRAVIRSTIGGPTIKSR
jgi:hypothetical protein